MTTIRCLAVSLILAAAVSARGAIAQDAPYPIVMKTTDALREAGIALHVPQAKHFKNKCYAYGEASYRFSVSDDLLARYKAKGFTLESLCMGLVSEARFDPETGKRLPTYIHFNVDGLRRELAAIRSDDPPSIRKYKGRDPAKLTYAELKECCESFIGFVTEELPLALPPCFRNGTPYTDCVWRHAIKSGERLSDASVEKFRNLGRALDERMAEVMRRKAQNCPPDPQVWPCAAAKLHNEFGELEPEGEVLFFLNGADTEKDFPGLTPIPEPLLKGQNLSFFDITPAFPRGYGYALYADGGAGPSASVSALRHAAGGGAPKSQVSTASLRRLIEQ